MKTKNLLRAVAVVSLLAVISCAKEIETAEIPMDTPRQSGEVQTYTMSVTADKGEADTKALSLNGNTLTASWAEGDEVKVYKGEALLGTLTARSSGESTTLSGTLEGSIETGDELTLKFLSPDYANQDGTLEYIATKCDYATATVTASVNGSNVTATEAAVFENQQAIVKFTLRNSDNTADTPVTEVRVIVGGDDLYTITPPNATNVVYVAIPSYIQQSVTVEGLNGPTYYFYTRNPVTFERGKYYSITVKMNESTDRRFIQCSWDAANKTVVKTETSIPLGATINKISYYSAGSDLEDWVLVSGTRTIEGNLNCKGDVKLILCDGAHLTITEGLTVNNYTTNNTLTIYCQSYGDSMGKLTVSSSTLHRNGIGGSTLTSTKSPHGAITIHGGNIKTTGGPCAVGLGSVRSESSPITIFGGCVEAHAGVVEASNGVNVLACPGIGIVGRGGSGASLTVYGGDVYAYGANEAAGIGGCDGYKDSNNTGLGDAGIINIYGGYVEAHAGSQYGAGIGGGQDGNGGTVTISGGSVKAYGGEDAAGIGSGEQNKNSLDGGSLTVNGGTVYAKGGDHGAGIGGGQDSNGATVVINDGSVSAYGGVDAAGVGSGEEPLGGPNINGGSLTVNGGYLFADGTEYGSGIGAGQDADGATVVINGGTVEAWAGDGSGAAAIGSEDGDGHRGSLTIGIGLTVYGREKDGASLEHFPYSTRVPGCYYRRYSRIEPCTSHEYEDGSCKWCGHTE